MPRKCILENGSEGLSLVAKISYSFKGIENLKAWPLEPAHYNTWYWLGKPGKLQPALPVSGLLEQALGPILPGS